MNTVWTAIWFGDGCWEMAGRLFRLNQGKERGVGMGACGHEESKWVGNTDRRSSGWVSACPYNWLPSTARVARRAFGYGTFQVAFPA